MIKDIAIQLEEEQRQLKKLEHMLNAQKEKVETLKNSMITEMTVAGTSSYKGATGTVITMMSKEMPTVDNWDALYQYISEHDAFDLLQRRISQTAYKDRADYGEQVSGVRTFTKKSLRINLSK